MDFPAYDEMIVEDQNTYSDEEEDTFSDIHQQGSSKIYMCDTCEREFQTYWQHQKHMSEHRTCGIDGCTFTAHEKIIEKHIQMQHSSGLYDKIRNLITPEDISKWIEERKKKYPKKENVEKRYKQQEEMLKRGEKLQRNSNSRFDRNNKTRFSLNRQNNNTHSRSLNKKLSSKRKNARQHQQQQQHKPISLIDDKSDWNGTLFPFKGTSQLYNEEKVEISNDFDDAEWSEEVKSNKAPEKIVLKNALGALMCAYNSGDDSEVEDLIPKKEIEKPKAPPTDLLNREKVKEDSSNIVLAEDKAEKIMPVELSNTNNTLSDDEAPTEQKIERLNILPEPIMQTPPSDNNKRSRKRKRVHKKGSNNFKQSSSNHNPNKQPDKFKNVYKKRRITLLERLLANEITHERNVLLQCVRYIVTNGFFDVKKEEMKIEKVDDCNIENVHISEDEIIVNVL